ncbi:alpha/beta fold hydrolase [bacterium AH-315-E10]|nr:alpha/beta fold hydrolase [bacterium AH-315-E10]
MSENGSQLHGWFIPATSKKAKGTVLHFHGNAENMGNHLTQTAWLCKKGYNVMTMDYQGYGKSEGRPSQISTVKDCFAAIDYVQKRRDVDPARVFIFGQSLGACLAITTIGKYGVRGLRGIIVEAPFYSYTAIIRDKINALPLGFIYKWPLSYLLILNIYSPSQYVDKIDDTKILFLHGLDDKTVDVKHSRWLYDKTTCRKELVEIKGARHLEAVSLYGNGRQIILRFMDQELKRKQK